MSFLAFFFPGHFVSHRGAPESDDNELTQEMGNFQFAAVGSPICLPDGTTLGRVEAVLWGLQATGGAFDLDLPQTSLSWCHSC